jgi:hypothetical protein
MDLSMKTSRIDVERIDVTSDPRVTPRHLAMTDRTRLRATNPPLSLRGKSMMSGPNKDLVI